MTKAAIALMILAALVGNYLRFTEPAAPGSIGLDKFEIDGVGEYQVEPLDDQFLDVLRAAESSFRTYDVTSETPVWVFLGYFDRQKEGSQVHSPKHCYPGSGWNIESESTTDAPWGSGKIKTLVVSDGRERRAVYYWFQTRDAVLGDVLHLKIDLTKKALLRRPQEVVFARVSTTLGDDRAGAEERLSRYAVHLNRGIIKLFNNHHEPG